jgi:hypothetical protein
MLDVSLREEHSAQCVGRAFENGDAVRDEEVHRVFL